MSKYQPLWEYIRDDGRDFFRLTYDEIAAVTGFPLDHSFLSYKKEAAAYGYNIGKISMKDRTVTFAKVR